MAQVATAGRTTPMAWAMRWPFLITFALFGWVAWHSPGFDDEITNIDLLEHLGTWSTVLRMQTEDVHPPGGYLINGLLFDLTGHWPAVRLVSALFYAGACAAMLTHVAHTADTRAAWWCWALALMNPAALMWGTSLRWYGYFLPLLMLCMIPRRRYDSWHPHAVLALGTWGLCMISYAGLLLAPLLLAWHWLRSSMGLRPFLRQAAWPWGLMVLAYAPQMKVFLTVHAAGSGGQVQGFAKSMAGVALALASNQGVFPLSIWGLISAGSWAVLAFLTARQLWAGRQSLPSRSTGVLSYLGAVGVFVATGLAAKFRNLVLMTPFQLFALQEVRQNFRLHPAGRWALFGLLAANVAGLWQVATHKGTTKNSWNMPIAAATQALEQEARACRTGQIQVFTIDPVLRKHLTTQHPDWVVLHGFQRFDAPAVRPGASCLLWVDTYLGSLSPERQKALQQAYAQLSGTRGAYTEVGANDFVSLKQRLDPNFPTHQVRLHRIDSPTQVMHLAAWVQSPENPTAPVPSLRLAADPSAQH